MRVLVTGAAGFVGSHLCELLLREDHDVRAMIHYNMGNIKHIKDDVGLIRADLRSYDECVEAAEGVDAVAHLGALIHVDRSRRYPRLFWEVNGGGTMNMLEAARLNDADFLMMSTCEIIGHIPDGRADENHPFAHPRSPYAASKYAAEAYCRAYNATYGGVNIARGFNLCGPRQKAGKKGAVIPIFISRVLNGEPPSIYGSGNQIRDFTDVRDVVRGLARILELPVDGELFHLCSGVGRTINEVAEVVVEVCGANMRPLHVKQRPGELTRSVGDNSKAHRMLGWKPLLPFERSVSDTADHLRSRRSTVK